MLAWGYNGWGECDVPEGLTDVTAIAAGAVHTVALVNNTGYTVSFDANGGIPVPDSQTVVAGATAVAPATALTKAGLTFAGWYSDADLTTAFDFATPITADLVLYAKWLAPTELISEMSDYITENMASGNIQKWGNSLIAKLDNIEAKLDRENTEAAINQLNAFINEVVAQKGKSIETATADQLIHNAQLIISMLNPV